MNYYICHKANKAVSLSLLVHVVSNYSFNNGKTTLTHTDMFKKHIKFKNYQEAFDSTKAFNSIIIIQITIKGAHNIISSSINHNLIHI